MRPVATPAILAALIAASSLPAAAQLTAPASATTSSPAITSTAGPAPKVSPADQKRIDAIQQYQHDLVNVVALRAESDYLLGAAILAKPFTNQTPGLDFDALSERAAAAAGAGPAAEWVRLDVCKDKSDCPNAKADAYLKQHAAGNAAIWLIDLDLAAAKKDAAAERRALARAAAAHTYDDYYGKALAAVGKAVTVLPPLADTTQGAHGGQPDNGEGVRLFVAVNATQTHLRPDLGPVVELCGKDAVAKHASTKADCLKLAHTLQWGSSPIARAVGLHIQGELNPADKTQNDQASRNLAWQVHQYSGLLQRALTDQPLASQWLATARNGGTELSLILATLRANQIPLDAPADAGSGGQ
ncbi:MAG: hypothetical protein OJF55_002271 [Rhodanobacteraceae bacterium]|jgi:hypothetical protein|nr:MAG: hypothetical protein OJF55_002271 [Rhodanobacteraceae bacterium]